MKIATYNVNGINARLPVLLQWLKSAAPDVVCLQELKTSSEKIPIEAVADVGYTGLWNGQKSWNGVAILTREYDIEETARSLPDGPEDVQSRYLEARVNGIIIGCIYLPNGNPAPGPKFDYKLEWMKRLYSHAQGLLSKKVPAILTGDFNVIPTELDAYKPERWVKDALFRTESRAAFQNLLDQGWADALREIYPEEKVYTFWDYYRNSFTRNAGIRIDHFLLSQNLRHRLKKAGVDKHVRAWVKTSDHAPVWIELE